MQITALGPPGLLLLTPRRFGDGRGWFSETWSRAQLAEAGVEADFLQDNHVFSAEPWTLRGLHLQTPPHPQAKLVRCSAGRIFDVAVDVRRGSPFHGQWRGVALDARTGAQLFVPRGFLHGYLTLTPNAEVQYKVDGAYAPDCEGAALWSDPDIGIDWPLPPGRTPLLSVRDAAAPAFAAFDTPFTYDPAS